MLTRRDVTDIYGTTAAHTSDLRQASWWQQSAARALPPFSPHFPRTNLKERLGYGLENRVIVVRFPVGTRDIFSELFRPALGPHEYREIFPRSKAGRRVKLTTHLQSVPRLSADTTTLLNHMSSWRAQQRPPLQVTLLTSLTFHTRSKHCRSAYIFWEYAKDNHW